MRGGLSSTWPGPAAPISRPAETSQKGMLRAQPLPGQRRLIGGPRRMPGSGQTERPRELPVWC